MKPFCLRLVYNWSTKIIRYAEAGEAPWFPRQSKVVKPCCCDPFLFFAHPKLHFRFFEKLRVMPASAKFCAHLSNKKLWSSERTTCRHKTLQTFQVQSGVLRSQSVETAQVLGNCLGGWLKRGTCQGWGKRIPSRWNSTFPLHRSQHTGNWTLQDKHQRPPHDVNDLPTRCHPNGRFP